MSDKLQAFLSEHCKPSKPATQRKLSDAEHGVWDIRIGAYVESDADFAARIKREAMAKQDDENHDP